MAKNKAVLGRGLQALLGSTAIDQPVDRANIVADDGRSVNVTSMIDIAKIQPNPFQPRRDFDPDKLNELSNSIRKSGVMTAITVRRFGDGFQLISGERRVRASIDAGLTEIPALILDIESDRQMMELSLVENIQREDLNPIEIATSYQQLITLCNLTQEELADSVGKERSTVANFMRLLKLPDSIQGSLRAGEISMGQARALLAIHDEGQLIATWNELRDHKLSVRQTEALVKKVTQAGKGATPARQPAKPSEKRNGSRSELDTTIAEISDRLQQVLGTQVRIKSNATGDGAIVIDYYSSEDLERLLDLFAIIERQNR